MTSRPSLKIAAALAVLGFALAVLLVREHAQAHAGLQGFCTLNDFVNCDRVATSRFSVVLGLPLAVWGGFGYGLAFLLAAAGLRSKRPHETWPAGLLFAVGGAATAAAVVLAVVSELVIGALCVLCAASWLVSAAIFATAWRATRPLGPLAALRADLGVLAAHPARAGGLVLAGAAVVALAAAAYPRYWERKPSADGRTAQARTAHPPAPAASGGPTVVVEFSDYQCPFCALAHEDLKALLAARPDVKLVKKHFPLDPACNPAMKRPMHPEACALALAAICAEEQGKLEPMDDALFRNQKAKRPIEELVREVRLDQARWEECLRSPSARRQLEADITTALAVGIRATPTYVVNGVRFDGGKLGPADLPPPSPGPAAQGR